MMDLSSRLRQVCPVTHEPRTETTQDYQSHFITMQDGLRLHLRDYGSTHGALLPVVCLAGLTRTSADFAALAQALAHGRFGPPRRVIAIDYRGRGQSDYDSDWHHYDVRVESTDIIAALTALSINEAQFIGTSRGGLIAMVLAAMRPGLIKALVLNDVGPVLEPKGLARIKSYVGKMPQPQSWADAVNLLKNVSSNHFPALSDDDWQAYARQTFQEVKGKLVPCYDLKLAKTLDLIDLDVPQPDLWPQFEAMRAIHMLVLRGALSDLLSEQTFGAMQMRHPGCKGLTVPGQGHAPLLRDELSMTTISQFLASV